MLYLGANTGVARLKSFQADSNSKVNCSKQSIYNNNTKNTMFKFAISDDVAFTSRLNNYFQPEKASTTTYIHIMEDKARLHKELKSLDDPFDMASVFMELVPDPEFGEEKRLKNFIDAILDPKFKDKSIRIIANNLKIVEGEALDYAMARFEDVDPLIIKEILRHSKQYDKLKDLKFRLIGDGALPFKLLIKENQELFFKELELTQNPEKLNQGACDIVKYKTELFDSKNPFYDDFVTTLNIMKPSNFNKFIDFIDDVCPNSKVKKELYNFYPVLITQITDPRKQNVLLKKLASPEGSEAISNIAKLSTEEEIKLLSAVSRYEQEVEKVGLMDNCLINIQETKKEKASITDPDAIKMLESLNSKQFQSVYYIYRESQPVEDWLFYAAETNNNYRRDVILNNFKHEELMQAVLKLSPKTSMDLLSKMSSRVEEFPDVAMKLATNFLSSAQSQQEKDKLLIENALPHLPSSMLINILDKKEVSNTDLIKIAVLTNSVKNSDYILTEKLTTEKICAELNKDNTIPVILRLSNSNNPESAGIINDIIDYQFDNDIEFISKIYDLANTAQSLDKMSCEGMQKFLKTLGKTDERVALMIASMMKNPDLNTEAIKLCIDQYSTKEKFIEEFDAQTAYGCVNAVLASVDKDFNLAASQIEKDWKDSNNIKIPANKKLSDVLNDITEALAIRHKQDPDQNYQISAFKSIFERVDFDKALILGVFLRKNGANLSDYYNNYKKFFDGEDKLEMLKDLSEKPLLIE